MNEYQNRVEKCINEKLVDFAMYQAKSIYNIDIIYHHFLLEEIKLFSNPQEHLSKAMVNAYNKTINEIGD